MKKVLILKGDTYKAVGTIFAERGYEPIYSTDGTVDPDLIVFTGGCDVSPYIYGEEPDGAVGCDPIRDEFEKSIYEAHVGHVPMIGICRGGQLLNVLNNGKMIQDHGLISGYVTALDLQHGKGYVELHVDHHQGMISNQGLSISLSLGPKLQSYASFYRDTRCLCFQPHPEWGHEGTKDYFFELVEKYIE